jgi:hypothetical protein
MVRKRRKEKIESSGKQLPWQPRKGIKWKEKREKRHCGGCGMARCREQIHMSSKILNYDNCCPNVRGPSWKHVLEGV